MGSQEVQREFEELKEAGKINSELEAFIEGKISVLNAETDELVEKIKEMKCQKTSREKFAFGLVLTTEALLLPQ